MLVFLEFPTVLSFALPPAEPNDDSIADAWWPWRSDTSSEGRSLRHVDGTVTDHFDGEGLSCDGEMSCDNWPVFGQPWTSCDLPLDTCDEWLSPPPPPPPQAELCQTDVDIVLVLDNSGSLSHWDSNVREFARGLLSQFRISPGR